MIKKLLFAISIFFGVSVFAQEEQDNVRPLPQLIIIEDFPDILSKNISDNEMKKLVNDWFLNNKDNLQQIFTSYPKIIMDINNENFSKNIKFNQIKQLERFYTYIKDFAINEVKFKYINNEYCYILSKNDFNVLTNNQK